MGWLFSENNHPITTPGRDPVIFDIKETNNSIVIVLFMGLKLAPRETDAQCDIRFWLHLLVHLAFTRVGGSLPRKQARQRPG